MKKKKITEVAVFYCPRCGSDYLSREEAEECCDSIIDEGVMYECSCGERYDTKEDAEDCCS